MWDEVDERYPDPDDRGERDAALSAAVQYLLGEQTPSGAGARVDQARAEQLEALAAARQIAVMAVEDGGSENAVAQQVRVTRRTLRQWQGKKN